MFLKSVFLRGFKTFADGTEIEFRPESRVTAIVGPNGCGKSNLLDAARWVIGEDNSRELRVASLESIIFAGSSDRKALSMAEVSMLFDNSDAKLPLPYSEVSIRRRTFRDGESEFFINKNLCRLKDIKDLLLDTGLGEGGYSIITQGQVDAILSSKGEERRAVFEEAAGINKYKVRKQAAEKKLIAAEQNLLRINDLKLEVNEHLVQLEEQARKAREYIELQKQVKELEIGLSKKVIVSILEKRSKLQEELDKARQASEEKVAAEKKDELEQAAAREALRKIEVEIEEAFARLDSEKDRLRDLELNRRFVEGELGREQRQLAELQAKQGEIGKKIESLDHPVDRPFALSSQLLETTLKEIIEQAARLIDQLSGVLAHFGSGQVFSLAGPAEKDESRKLKMELLQAENQRLAAEIERLHFGQQAHQNEMNGFSVNVTGSEAKSSLQENISRLKQERENLNQRISRLDDKIRKDIKNEVSTASLEIGLARLEGEMNGLCERLYLEYNLSLEEIQVQPYEIGNISKAKSEVEEGKRRLRMLEPVNLLAIEEYDKTAERISFLEMQLTDLNGARENLRNLITELDMRAEENFVRTMQQLSAIFSDTFSRLFNGGEAKIALIPGPTALESEIDISVRPAGRKWLPLTMLSGGERALSAIAILFSLLRIRPSPFCFLDEVDAALDEANIGRFTDILKDFSAVSQIIVITHNKKTMAVADQIYGVTMEAPGVSKVISMRLAEAAV